MIKLTRVNSTKSWQLWASVLALALSAVSLYSAGASAAGTRTQTSQTAVVVTASPKGNNSSNTNTVSADVRFSNAVPARLLSCPRSKEMVFGSLHASNSWKCRAVNRPSSFEAKGHSDSIVPVFTLAKLVCGATTKWMSELPSISGNIDFRLDADHQHHSVYGMMLKAKSCVFSFGSGPNLKSVQIYVTTH